jgi:hypothetical protein
MLKGNFFLQFKGNISRVGQYILRELDVLTLANPTCIDQVHFGYPLKNQTRVFVV